MAWHWLRPAFLPWPCCPSSQTDASVHAQPHKHTHTHISEVSAGPGSDSLQTTPITWAVNTACPGCHLGNRGCVCRVQNGERKGTEERLTTCTGLELVVPAQLYPSSLSPLPFWFLPKLQHLEGNDYSCQAAKTTYQQFHTLQKQRVREEEGMSTCSRLQNISTQNKLLTRSLIDSSRLKQTWNMYRKQK